jgi:hypothetical protein
MGEPKMKDIREQRTLNRVNKKAGSEYGSGLVGVTWVKGRGKGSGKWRARIELNGKFKHLGMFTELEDALNARKEANAHYGVVSVANTDCGLIEYNRDEETLKIIKEFEQERRELEDTIKARENASTQYALTQEQA